MIISRMMIWSEYVTHFVQKRNAISSDEPNQEVRANGMVKWCICSLPMELTYGSEYVTDFEISDAETEWYFFF
jgi:hypothetical protein